MHAVAVDFHPPDDEAYGRVTNPGRYQVVVDATRIMIDELVATYEVGSMAGVPTVDFPDFQGPAADVVRLHPSEGAPLAFMFTEFPGVVVRAGELCVEAFPVCGCDACDESPTDVIERMEELVSAVFEGRYAEALTREHSRTRLLANGVRRQARSASNVTSGSNTDPSACGNGRH